MTALDDALSAAERAGIVRERHTVGDITIHVARFGSGEPLLLLHGWPEFWLSWRPVMERLGDAFALVAPDLRGFGDTAKPAPGPDATATADRHAQDMLGLMDALGIQRFGVAAGDVGAYVAQALCRMAPERIVGTFYFCTIYPGIGRRYGAAPHLIEVWYQYFQQLPLATELVGSSRAACRMYLKHFLDHWSGDNPAVFADKLEIYVDNFMKPGNLQGGFDWYLSSARTRVAMLDEHLPKHPPIAVPSHFMWGRRDPLVKPEWSDRLGEYFSDYAIDFVDAGHFVPVELPDRAAQEIRVFFDRINRPWP
jgi:pimeloyl-ACP methyl ester carboxylesterase